MLLQGEVRDQPHFSLLITRFSLVSVPLRGKGRDQQCPPSELVPINPEKVFPSPCGEKVGINGSHPDGPTGAQGQFPSPCGEKVGINQDSELHGLAVWAVFPSPCGEKVGINPAKAPPWLARNGRFRPLAGKR